MTGPAHNPEVTAETADLYRNTALDMLATSILQQIRNIEQIQIIKGEPGLGKTCFCRRLQQEAPADVAILYISTGKKTGIIDILQQINEEDANGDLQTSAKTAAQRIYRYLYDHRQPVLLIDDAHRLSSQTLTNLIRFQHAIAQQNSGGLKLILVGERKIDTRLEAIDETTVSKDHFVSALLRPLNRNEIEDYLNFKFGPTRSLSVKQLQYIRDNSGGIPGKIESLGLRAEQGNPLNKKGLFLGIMAIAIAFTAYLFFNSVTQVQKQTPKPPIKPAIEEPARTSSVSPAAIQPNETENSFDVTEPAGTTGEVESRVAVELEPASALELLSNLPAEHYLIQLLGSYDRERMQSYREELALAGQLILYASERNGQNWYLLFYGPFPDYETALHARDRLPEIARASQPWIRQIGSILEKD